MKNNYGLSFFNKIISTVLAMSVMAFSVLFYSQAYSQESDWRANNLEGFKNPLIEASSMGLDTLVARALEAKNRDNNYINIKGKNGTTALIEAVYAGNISTIQLLLKNGADVTIKDNSGKTAISIAKKVNNSKIIGLLQNHSAKQSLRKAPIKRRSLSNSTQDHSKKLRSLNQSNNTIKNKSSNRLNRFRKLAKKPTKRVGSRTGAKEKSTKIKKVERKNIAKNPRTLGQVNGYVYTKDGFVRPDVSNKIEKENVMRAEQADDRKSSVKWKNYGLAALGVAVVGGGVAALASGGGGSSSGSSSGGTVPTSGSSGSSGNSSGAVFDTAEFQNQPALAQINAINAYDRGYTGSNILVAVIDNGVDINHPDLAGKIDARSFDFIGNDSDPTPTGFGSLQSLGTNVAGIIAANKNDSGMHGLAYGASILALRAGTSGGAYSKDKLAEALDYAVTNGARIVNNSYSSSLSAVDASNRAAAISLVGLNTVNSYLTANISGVINVWATGNNSSSEPSLEAGLPRQITELKGKWIAVSAVDNNNQISSFANRCGVAAEWCIVAPGENINGPFAAGDIADGDNDGYGIFSGTTQSAPLVSAAAAILMEAFPTLTPEQVVELLLSTATDLGETGTDAIYGRGLLNLDAATAPQGSLKVPSSNKITGKNSLLKSSFIATGGAFGDAIAKSNASFTVLDKYNRSYQTNLANSVSPTNFSSDSHQLLLSFGKKYVPNKAKLNENTIFLVSERDAYIPRTPTQNDFDSKKASFITTTKNTEVAVNYNVPMEEAFRFNAADDYNKNMMIGKYVLTNPFLSFAGDGVNVTSSHKLTQKSSFKVAAFYGSKEDDKYGQYTNKSTGVVGELSYATNDNSVISFQAGVMNENDSFLGTQSSGAFALLGNNKTFFIGLAGSHELTDNLSIFGSISSGISYINGGNNDSILRDISTINSYSFSVGATYKGAMAANDTLGFAISQPLKVSSGSANLYLPTSTDRNGNIYYTDSNIGLAPSGREMDIEAFYALPVNDSTSINTGAIYRKDPGHIADAKDEGILMLKINHNF